MSSEIYGYDGFQDLADIIEYYTKGADNFIDVLEVGAKEFVNDLEYQFEIYKFTDAGSKLILCVGIGNPNISFMDALHEAVKTTLAFVQK